MSSAKRKMPPASLLQRRVRPRYEPEPEDIEDDMSDAPSEEGAGSFGSDDEDGEELSSGDESGSGSDEDNSDAASGSEEDDSEEEEEEDDDTPQIDAAQLSFGALAKAQAAMSSSSKRKPADDDRTATEKPQVDDGYGHPKTAFSTKKHEKRSSKHAPVEITSKKAVSRKRDFLTVTGEARRSQARDPRFTPLGAGAGIAAAGRGGSAIDEIKARKAYAFLDDYRESEMAELRVAIKKSKDAAAKEKLQKALMSMESRKRTQDRRDRERTVMEEHRKKEKELVSQGKTPFYLKKAEQKKLVLVDQFQGLKKGQVDKAIERRRKKVAGKEKKLLPFARRGAEDR